MINEIIDVEVRVALQHPTIVLEICRTGCVDVEVNLLVLSKDTLFTLCKLILLVYSKFVLYALIKYLQQGFVQLHPILLASCVKNVEFLVEVLDQIANILNFLEKV